MLRKRLMTLALAVVMTVSVFTGCGSKDDSKTSRSESKKTEQQKSDAKKEKAAEKEETKAPIEDGTYTAEFDTDSGMFHVNEANDGKGTLTVKDGKMTIHVSLASKKIVNLFVGKAEDAQKDGAEVLEPTTDTVTYSDGMSEEVYGFDIPVPAIDEEFDVALIGTKGKWYDHKVSVKNPVKSDDTDAKKDDKENKSTYIKTDVEGTLITITCYNFNNSLGSGTVYPQNLATIGGKKLYFHFIVYKISQESSRHIIYTFYEDIK